MRPDNPNSTTKVNVNGKSVQFLLVESHKSSFHVEKNETVKSKYELKTTQAWRSKVPDGQHESRQKVRANAPEVVEVFVPARMQ